MDVVFYEAFSEEVKILKSLLPPKIKAQYTKDTFQAHQGDYKGNRLISIRTQSIFPATWRDKCAGVLTRSSGWDHLSDFLRKCDYSVPAGFLPKYCARSVAEHAIMMMLALLKGLKKEINHFDTFNRDSLTGQECFGRRLLVIGVGNIGCEIVKLGRGMDMLVKGVDLVERYKDLDYTPLKSGIKWADIIVSALPLTEKTNKMLGFEALSKARKGFIFINISRGEISPNADLLRLQAEGHLGGLGMDAFEDEASLADGLRNKDAAMLVPHAKFLEMGKADNVIFTPHNAFNTDQALNLKAYQSVESIKYFLKHKDFPYPVPNER